MSLIGDHILEEFSLNPHSTYYGNAGETGEITTTHLLLGIWSQKNSAGHKILATLGFDDEKAKQLAKFVSLLCRGLSTA